MKIEIADTKVGHYLQSSGVNKTIRVAELKDNYPKCEPIGLEGYNLICEDKTIYTKWHTIGDKTMSKIIVESKWVKANVNVFEGDALIIRSEGSLESSQLDPTKKDWHFDVELPDGTVKDAKFNKTSIVNLTEGFGTNDSTEWLGKSIVVKEVVKYAKGAGCIYAVKK